MVDSIGLDGNETGVGSSVEEAGGETIIGPVEIENNIPEDDNIPLDQDGSEPFDNENAGASYGELVGGVGNYDTAGDQQVDIFKTIDRSSGLWDDINSQVLGYTYGNPETDVKLWKEQGYPDTCAIKCQEYILESFLDHDFTERELVAEAMEKGYYTPGSGTYEYNVGRILEDYDIDVQRSSYNTMDDIKEKLSMGQKIIVSIDSNEIWSNSIDEQLKDLNFMPQANHAVTVIGYDDHNDTVILNDPGHPNGGGLEVSLKDFKNAWEDSDCFMVSTINAPATSIA